MIKWRFRQYRVARNLRQEDVAHAAELSLRRYQQFESDAGAERFNPTLNTLLRLAEALEVPVGVLLAAPSRSERNKVTRDASPIRVKKIEDQG